MKVTENLPNNSDDLEDIDASMISFFHKLEEMVANKMYVINPPRVKEFMSAYNFLKEKYGKTHTVTYSHGTGMFITSMSIRVRGKDIFMYHPEDVVKNALSAADNFEVHAYLDGTVELTVTFYGVTKGVN